MKNPIWFLPLFVAATAQAQPVVLSENFDSYNGLVASVPAGFSISWNDTSGSSKSYYSTSGFCGQACNAYKFGVDSAEMVTAPFANPGSVSFYLKGNGTFQPNTFHVYESPNGTAWSLVATIDSIPAAAQTVTLPLAPSTTRLRFFYKKDVLGYNAGFDDLVVYGPVGTGPEAGWPVVTVFPSPAASEVSVDFGLAAYESVSIDFVDMTGRTAWSQAWPVFSGRYRIDVAGLPGGLYLLHVRAGNRDMVRRVVIGR